MFVFTDPDSSNDSSNLEGLLLTQLSINLPAFAEHASLSNSPIH